MSDTTDISDAAVKALRERYKAERDKRMRSEGGAQYQDMKGRLARFDADPNADPNFTRDAVSEDIDVALVGAGYSGLMSAAKLVGAGVTNMRIIDRAADFGGTWYWNRYPGAACDTESYIYMPFLDETGYVPTEKYAKAPEIFAHCQRIGRHFGLYDKALFQTRVTSVRWDDATARWEVRTDRGDHLRARFVVIGTGVLSKAKLPGIPGIERFTGHSFHTSRWDYAYTGGGPAGKMPGLADKRVGIIGTGSTAIQAIPPLAESAAHLYVFQRTPSSIDRRDNRPTDPEWAASLEPGWQRRRMQNFNAIIAGIPQDEDQVADAWTEIFRDLAIWRPVGDFSEEERQQLRIANMARMEAIRARIDSAVSDPATADALKPYYDFFCKRPGFHDSYLDAFNRPNVTLVDTDGRGVDSIDETSVRVGDKFYAVDCLIFSTGFEFGMPADQAGDFVLEGRGGLTIASKWSAGVRTLFGMHYRGFPNMLIVGSALQGAASPNVPSMTEVQSDHVASMIARCINEGYREIEPTADAEDWWRDQILTYSSFDEAAVAECTPSFLNAEGKATAAVAEAGPYARGVPYYDEMLQEWRAGRFRQDLEIRRRDESADTKEGGVA